MKSFSPLLLAAALFLAGAAQAVETQTAFVSEALSGDTLRLKGGKILRYAGIKAPPLQSLIPLVRTYGENAAAFNRDLVAGKTIRVEWGPQIRDERGDLLGYVYLEDGTFVNLELIKQGHAKVWIKAPNLVQTERFRKTELEARRERRGVWKEEPVNPFLKSEYIGEKNTKIYYFPTSPELERIPEAQLVTFRSRVEAKAAGYRPCSTCKEGAGDPYAE